MISSSLRLRRKERKGIPGWGFFLFFTSDQTRLRKFARRPFFVIRAAQIRKPLNATNAIFVNLSTSNFPSDIHPLRRQELLISTSSVFLCLAPSRWGLQPNSQPIPARPLPFERLGLSYRPALQRQSKLKDHLATGSIHSLKAVLTKLGVNIYQTLFFFLAVIHKMYRFEKRNGKWNLRLLRFIEAALKGSIILKGTQTEIIFTQFLALFNFCVL